MKKRLISKREFAHRVGISENTLYRWINEGKVDAYFLDKRRTSVLREDDIYLLKKKA